jgi:hypothetical protein
MRNSTLLVFLAVGLSASLCSANDDAPADPAQEKYALRYVYRPGKRLLRYEIDEQRKLEDEADDAMSIKSTILISLDISEGDEARERPIKMKFRRIFAELKAGDLSKVVDSDKPETLLPNMPLDALTRVTFRAVLDEAGNLTSVTGAKEFLEESNIEHANEDEKAQFQAAVEAGVRQLLQEPLIYFPDKPVSVGDSWTLRRKTYGLPIMAARKVHDEEVTCKLAEVSETKQGRVAVISITGETAIVEGAAPEDPKSRKKTGKIEYDIDNKLLLSHHVDLEGSGSITLDDGNEMKLSVTTAVDATIETDTDSEADPAKSDDTAAPA